MNIYSFIYLLYKDLNSAKEREKKERQVRRAKKRKETQTQRTKPPYLNPPQATDAHIGDEE